MANKHRRRELDASIAERQIPITNSRRIRQEEAENIAAEYRAKRDGWGRVGSVDMQGCDVARVPSIRTELHFL